MRNVLRRKGFFSYKPAQKPFLNARYRKLRREWVNDKVNWSMDHWNKVIWSDESRFALRYNDGGVRIIRKKGERYNNRFILPTFKFGDGMGAFLGRELGRFGGDNQRRLGLSGEKRFAKNL